MKTMKTRPAATLFAFAGLALAASSAYAQPANDDCTGAIPIFDGITPVSNLDATSDGSDVCASSSFEVYYAYTATFTGTVQIDTCNGATFDTVVTVYDTCFGTELACNDDNCGLSSKLFFEAVQGQTYIIRFASFGTFSPEPGTADMYIGVPLPTDIESFGFASPDPVFAGGSSLMQVFVFPGEFPDSTGIVVTADTSAFQGGSPSVVLNDDGLDGDEVAGDDIYSATLNVAEEEAAGFFNISYSVVDDQGRTSNESFGLEVIGTPQYFEASDAGDLIATAQVPTGADPFLSLGGTIATGTDVDMYLINVCDFANFSASTDGNGTIGDTQLFLFRPDGTGVTFSDQTEFSSQSLLTNQFLTANGDYYLAVNFYNVDAVDESNQLIWEDFPFDIERAPDGPGALGSLVGWDGDAFGNGIYVVDFTGTCFAGEPVNLCNYDYNQDENVDLTDAQQMAQVAAGIIAADPSWLSGDLNLDENADLTDAQQLAAFVASGICPV